MAIYTQVGTKKIRAMTDDGIPYLWGSGDLESTEATTPTFIAKIKPSDGAANGFFAIDIKIADGRIVVGCYLDSRNGTNWHGSLYIFDLNGTQIAKLVNPDGYIYNNNYGKVFAVGNGRIVVRDKNAYSGQGAFDVWDINGNYITRKAATSIVYGHQIAQIQFPVALAIADGNIFAHSQISNNPGDTDITGYGIWGATYRCDLNGNRVGLKNTLSTTWLNSMPENGSITTDTMVAGEGIILQAATSANYPNTNTYTGVVFVLDYNGRCIGRINHPNRYNFSGWGTYMYIGCGRIAIASHSGNNEAGRGLYIFDMSGNLIKHLPHSIYLNIGYAKFFITDGRIYVFRAPSIGGSLIFTLDGEEIGPIPGIFTEEYSSYAGAGEGRIVIGHPGDADNGTSSGAMYIYSTPRIFTPYDVISSNSTGI